jgi:hypothetical protein
LRNLDYLLSFKNKASSNSTVVENLPHHLRHLRVKGLSPATIAVTEREKMAIFTIINKVNLLLYWLMKESSDFHFHH